MSQIWCVLRAAVYSAFWVLVLIVWIPSKLHSLPTIGQLLTDVRGEHSTWFLGVAFLLLGTALSLSCVVEFVTRGRGTPAPFDPPRKLVSRGPYKFLRNPMYTGNILMLMGDWLITDITNPWAVGYILFFIGGCSVLVLYIKEPRLRRKFGASYVDYCRSTGRWCPRLGTGARPSNDMVVRMTDLIDIKRIFEGIVIASALHVTEEYVYPGGFLKWLRLLFPSIHMGVKDAIIINTVLLGWLVQIFLTGPEKVPVSSVAAVTSIMY